jgi:hypothetical protein
MAQRLTLLTSCTRIFHAVALHSCDDFNDSAKREACIKYKYERCVDSIEMRWVRLKRTSLLEEDCIGIGVELM